MHRICQIAMVVAVMFASGGCVFYGHSKGPPSPEPMQFVDAVSGRTLSEVLVIPRYASYSFANLGGGAGHGGVGVDGQSGAYAAHPFRYRAGDPFAPDAPKTLGVGVPGAIWVIDGRSFEGVAIVAPGYSQVWITDLFRSENRRVELSPLSPSHSLPELARIRDALRLGRIDDHGLWSLGYDDLEIRLSQPEREQAIAFLDDAIARLAASNPATNPSTQRAAGP